MLLRKVLLGKVILMNEPEGSAVPVLILKVKLNCMLGVLGVNILN